MYSWSELRARPLPDGVDPAKLEKYLSDQDFQVGVNTKSKLVWLTIIDQIDLIDYDQFD